MIYIAKDTRNDTQYHDVNALYTSYKLVSKKLITTLPHGSQVYSLTADHRGVLQPLSSLRAFCSQLLSA